jgi:hypothetical protein
MTRELRELPLAPNRWLWLRRLGGVSLCVPLLIGRFADLPSSEPVLEPHAIVERSCADLAAKLSSLDLASCLARDLVPTGAQSVNGNHLLIKEYPPLPDRKPLGRVLLFGGIHGDEFSSVTIVFKWLEILDRFHSGLFHWRISPVINPDGLLKSPGTRTNARGVDLNRNFPSPNWLQESHDYWVRRTSRNPRRYPGTAPLSEPESRWLKKEIELFQPDAIVSVHAPHHVVDFDGPPKAPQKLGSLRLYRFGTYPGSLGRWAGEHRGLPVITIELPSAGIMPPEAEQERIWIDLIRYLRLRFEGKRPLVAESGPESEAAKPEHTTGL